MIPSYCYYCTITRIAVAIGCSIVELCCANIIVLVNSLAIIVWFDNQVIVWIVTDGSFNSVPMPYMCCLCWVVALGLCDAIGTM